MWARHTLSRDALISSFKTFLWVVPLTVMIWIYAEREQLATYPNVPIKIEPQNNDPNRVVTFADATGPRLTISADLVGPHGRLEQVQRQLETSLALRLDFDPRLDNGTHRIPTRLLGDDSLFKENGITVRSIVPEEVTIKIDPVETREFSVQPPSDNSNRLVSFTSDPKTVKVSAPQTFFREHPGLVVRAEVSLDTSAGPHEDKGVTLAPSVASRFVTITPSTASAKYEVRQADVPYKIDSMIVWVTYPPTSEWNKYMAVLLPQNQNSIINVTVIGPQEVIDRFKDPNFPKPHAFFEVEDGNPDVNRPDGPYSAPLHYMLPDPRLRVDENWANAKIQFKIQPRPAE